MIAREILSDALKTYGAEAQTLMVMEEMSELTKELCKHARGADNTDAIAEEIADVYIMLNQMEILHKVEDRVMWWFNAKFADESDLYVQCHYALPPSSLRSLSALSAISWPQMSAAEYPSPLGPAAPIGRSPFIG